jgi:hypothetical protein
MRYIRGMSNQPFFFYVDLVLVIITSITFLVGLGILASQLIQEARERATSRTRS